MIFSKPSLYLTNENVLIVDFPTPVSPTKEIRLGNWRLWLLGEARADASTKESKRGVSTTRVTLTSSCLWTCRPNHLAPSSALKRRSMGALSLKCPVAQFHARFSAICPCWTFWCFFLFLLRRVKCKTKHLSQNLSPQEHSFDVVFVRIWSHLPHTSSSYFSDIANICSWYRKLFNE